MKLIKLNFFGGLIAIAAAYVMGILDMSSGREIGTAGVVLYMVGLFFLLTALGLWAYRKFYMRSSYASLQPRPVSNNMIRRQRRSRPPSKDAFLEVLEINKGIRVERPELVKEVQNCQHPDYIKSHGRSWNCTCCSLTVIADAKPKPGPRAVATL